MAAIYWITGFPGAGKTMVGENLYRRLKSENHACVLLDGDVMRKVFGDDLGYSKDDRLKSALRLSNLCKLLSDQGITTVCCTVSMFNSVRDWNRANIQGYTEIYLQVPQDILRKRKPKVYESANSDEIPTSVALQMEEPKTPDLLFLNNGSITIDEIVKKILEKREEYV
jgi:adenylylsulfate kinase